MTQVIDIPLDFIPFEGRRLSRKVLSHTVPGAIILAVSALGGAGLLYMRPEQAPNVFHAPAAPAVEAAAHQPAAPAPAPAVNVASNTYGALFDPGFSSGSTPASLTQTPPAQSNNDSVAPAASVATAEPEIVLPTQAEPQLGESAPMPPPRPPELETPASRSPLPIPDRRLGQQNRRPAIASAPPDNRNFFEKLFGMPQPSGRALAYAAPEGGLPAPAPSITSAVSPRADRGTAVYDVAAHTVYMPDGTRLEAHSGLGERMDDPRYVHEHNRGATPPNVYELSPREQLFHGVQALRLTPVGGGSVYGRTGFLAHTYMLGPNGASNGCVSFKDYKAFLQAYQNGQIKRLVVVARQS